VHEDGPCPPVNRGWVVSKEEPGSGSCAAADLQEELPLRL